MPDVKFGPEISKTDLTAVAKNPDLPWGSMQWLQATMQSATWTPARNEVVSYNGIEVRLVKGEEVTLPRCFFDQSEPNYVSPAPKKEKSTPAP